MMKSDIMDDEEVFNEAFRNLSSRYKKLKMEGTLVYYDGVCKFNTDGYNLCYNLLRLTQVINDAGELR